MTRPRRETIDPSTLQIVHVYNQSVRGHFLCGSDPLTGKDYSYRKEWSQKRLEHLASCFGIDVIAYAIMSNHYHQILRSRPDVVSGWSAREVAIRWLRISPKLDRKGRPKPPTKSKINGIVNDRKKLAEYRRRLSDISWFMRYYSQHIAVRSNREDGVRGHFWGSRFGHTMLEDDPAVLACMIYVDLNPVHAGIATTPEDSDYTSGKDRSDDLRLKLFESGDQQYELKLKRLGSETHQWERLGGENSGWLAPIEMDERTDPTGADHQIENQADHEGQDPEEAESKASLETVAKSKESGVDESQRYLAEIDGLLFGHRCSRKGVLPISLSRYLEALDTIGRQVRSDKNGSIAEELEPILSRLGIGIEKYEASYRTITSKCYRYTQAPPVVLQAPDSVAQRQPGMVASDQRLTPMTT